MAALTPEQRRLRAQVAANARWAKEPDRSAATAAARATQWQRYLDKARELAPVGASEEDVDRRAHSLWLADQQRRSLKAVTKRKRRKALARAEAEVILAAEEQAAIDRLADLLEDEEAV